MYAKSSELGRNATCYRIKIEETGLHFTYSAGIIGDTS